jgi:hypothetical protein
MNTTPPSSVGRRQAMALAAALTLAVGTAVAAIGGIARTPAAAPPAASVTPALVQPAQHFPEADD